MGKFVVAVDIGTSSIRACLYDKAANLQSTAERQVELEYSGTDAHVRVELDPDLLWGHFTDVVKEATATIDPHDIATIGICSQRNTFITWDKLTQEPCHKFVTWKDGRGTEACQMWNRSWMVKFLNVMGAVLYFLTGRKRFLGARIYTFLNVMVTHRLMVTIDQRSDMQALLRDGRLVFGCIDTWLLFKLTGGRLVATEPSSASATGLYDPFLMDWGHFILNRISFPTSLLPPVLDTAGKPIAVCDSNIFGAPIPIGAIMADQQAAVIGTGCWNTGQVKISLGTGTFLNANTGQKPHASIRGLYPLVGWRLGKKTTFIAEASANDTATTLRWAQLIGLFESVETTADLAASVSSSDGVAFVPAFGGLQAPINDDRACCGFLGLRPDTTKAVMVRAVLEAFAFRVFQIWNVLCDELDFPIVGAVRCCGGVSRNDFVCQAIADLIGRPVERVNDESFSAALGVAFLAGVSVDFWREEELKDFVRISRVFEPREHEHAKILVAYNRWCKAVERCLHFYT